LDARCNNNLLSQSIVRFLNSAEADPITNSCPVCGSQLEQRKCTFFYAGQTWEIQFRHMTPREWRRLLRPTGCIMPENFILDGEQVNLDTALGSFSSEGAAIFVDRACRHGILKNSVR
jgi:hypothetical protein